MRILTVNLLIAVSMTISVAGCKSYNNKPGHIRVTKWSNAEQKPLNPSKSSTTTEDQTKGKIILDVTQPSNPAEGASVVVNGIRAQIGSSHGQDQALAQLQPLTWAGIIACVAGVGLMIARAWLPIIPVSASLLTLALGAGFIAMPMLLDRYLGWIAFGGGVVLVIVAGFFAYRSRWFDQQISAEVQQKLVTKGDIRGAGALAWLRKNAPMTRKSTATAASEIVMKAKASSPGKV